MSRYAWVMGGKRSGARGTLKKADIGRLTSTGVPGKPAEATGGEGGGGFWVCRHETGGRPQEQIHSLPSSVCKQCSSPATGTAMKMRELPPRGKRTARERTPFKAAVVTYRDIAPDRGQRIRGGRATGRIPPTSALESRTVSTSSFRS